MASVRRILITGATGKQGGALARALAPATNESRAQSFELIALTRNITSASAQRLSQQSNVKLLQGDLDDVPTIFEQISSKFGPLYGVFSVQTPLHPHREEAQGKALADHAAQNGVKHFIYTSADRGGPRSETDSTPIPHFISKFNIEKRIKEVVADSGNQTNWTIIRPVAFMENLTPNFFGKVFGNAWTFHGRDRKMQLVSTESVGLLAAEAFRKPEEYAGRSISLASDSLSFNEGNAIFERRFGYGIPKTYDWLAGPIINFAAKKELGMMFDWIREEGFGADVEECRRSYPDMMDFEQWLEKASKFSKT